MTEPEPNDKYEALQESLREMGSVLIAFSGGVDSTFLLRAALAALGPENVLAVTARSPSFPKRELGEARELAQQLGARHVEFDTDELHDPQFAANPEDRCYFCKKELFGRLRAMAQDERLAVVADASNYDDAESDYRPGLRAAEELGIRSPLREARLGKREIRKLSARLGLPTADKPSAACLASRIPYGESITEEKLHRIEQAEELLRGLGFRQFRVRSHGTLARIELGPDEHTSALLNGEAGTSVRDTVVRGLKELGYAYVTLDLEGYRSGSMNEVLSDGGNASSGR